MTHSQRIATQHPDTTSENGAPARPAAARATRSPAARVTRTALRRAEPLVRGALMRRIRPVRLASMAPAPLAAALVVLSPGAGMAADRFEQPERVKVGVLTCDIEGGLGFLIGSSRRLECRYSGVTGRESYGGRITKLGADIGPTGRQVLSWTVFAPATTDVFSGLEGRYAGVSASAALGPGFGTNVLLGGSARRVVLQPVSVQTGSGLNATAAITGLRLRRL